jgi:16S rRNA (guanine527-N7)-methyltransferase
VKNDALLCRVLEVAQEKGFLGPSPVVDHIHHAARFSTEIERAFGSPPPELRILDLGSGAGVPGLSLALGFLEFRGLLLDASPKRVSFLDWALVECGLDSRFEARCGRAETLARDATMRERFDIVVARSFGRAAVAAECGVPFLRIGGKMFVSEPPEMRADRWTDHMLSVLGVRSEVSSNLMILEKTTPSPDTYPRRSGIPSKRPLF